MILYKTFFGYPNPTTHMSQGYSNIYFPISHVRGLSRLGGDVGVLEPLELAFMSPTN